MGIRSGKKGEDQRHLDMEPLAFWCQAVSMSGLSPEDPLSCCLQSLGTECPGEVSPRSYPEEHLMGKGK